MKNKPGEIARVIRLEIETGKNPENRLEAIPRLAARLGTSVNTIQAALSILERDGLIERKRGSGVYIRERRKPKTVGILCEHDILHLRCSVFFTQLVRELRIHLAQNGMRTNLYLGEVPLGTANPDRITSRHFMEDLASGRLDGVMLVCTKELPELVSALAEAHVPVIGGTGQAEYSVETNPDMVAEGVCQLKAQGCRRIALMAGNTPAYQETFAQAMHDQGLPIVPEWTHGVVSPEWPGAGWELFREIWSACAEKPDGLLAMDDILFRDAMVAIRELDIAIPEQLRIVAHATRGAMIDYPKAAVRLEIDPAEAARLMGGMLVRLMAGESVGQRRVMVPFRILPAQRAADNRQRVGQHKAVTARARGKEMAK